MTTQTRLFLTAGKTEAERVFTMLEHAFEEDGLPISTSEVDEDREIFEVSVYTFEPDEIETRIKDILGGDAFGLRLEREQVPDIDWVAHSLEGLKPVRAGRFFVHGSHDRDKRRANDLGIEIDAGLAFGTGHHGTTSGCLDMMGEVIRRERPRNALDLGTGSAVLAIGIAKLTPIPVLATDIDPVAVAVAHDNVVKNGVASRVRTATATGFHHPAMRLAAPFDLIVANILAGPLIELSESFAAATRTGGRVLLSGLLVEQADMILSTYGRRGFTLEHHIDLETGAAGWRTLLLRHTSRPPSSSGEVSR